jgi:SAM-dependent methyltransferase
VSCDTPANTMGTTTKGHRMDSQAYYDEHVPRRLRDFVVGNRRIEAAWDAITAGANGPRSVLEVGCGIGFVAWWASQRWSGARVTAVDSSEVSIDVARRMFDGPRYEHGRLESLDLDLGAPFDLIIMMDVYEHVPTPERASLHRQIERLLAPGGHVFLSFPTAEYQQHLREDEPSKLQPVDEDVHPGDMGRFADDVGGTVTWYRKVSVWRRCDYAHCWIERVEGAGSQRVLSPERSFAEKVCDKSGRYLQDRSRRARERMVVERLGSDELAEALGS